MDQNENSKENEESSEMPPPSPPVLAEPILAPIHIVEDEHVESDDEDFSDEESEESDGLSEEISEDEEERRGLVNVATMGVEINLDKIQKKQREMQKERMEKKKKQSEKNKQKNEKDLVHEESEVQEIEEPDSKSKQDPKAQASPAPNLFAKFKNVVKLQTSEKLHVHPKNYIVVLLGQKSNLTVENQGEETLELFIETEEPNVNLSTTQLSLETNEKRVITLEPREEPEEEKDGLELTIYAFQKGEGFKVSRGIRFMV